MMKEMEYTGHRCVDVLGHGEIDGYKWAILSYGTNPCAYVSPPEDHPAVKLYHSFRKTGFDHAIKVHGGVTFAEYGLHEVDPDGKRFWLGWDYAHYDDYVLFDPMPPLPGKKWTVNEIFSEVEQAIGDLKKMKELDKWNG